MTETVPAATLRWKDLADLTASTGYPCVTLLLSTTPGPRMSATDVLALTGLLHRAARLLDPLEGGEVLGERLQALAARATRQPVGTALGLFVNRDLARSIVLPVEVSNRVVLEPSFATRDLLRALHRTPPYLLLTLYPGVAGFFQAQGCTLTPVGSLPLRVDPAGRSPERGADAATSATEAMLEEVDALLERHRAGFPSPLVLAGTSALVEAFSRRSRHLTRLAGRITDAQTPDQLQQAAARALGTYLRSRGQEALDLIERTLREQPSRVAAGLTAAWTRAHSAVPLLLAVEHGFAAPGHHFATFESGPGEDPVWVHDLVDDPFFVDDLVDDLLEVVVHLGGWVAFVEDGALAEHGRVVLVSDA